MSLRTKIVWIVSIVVMLYAGADHLIQRRTITPSFRRLEQHEAQKDVQRVVDALSGEIEHLDARCREWASWDETYAFAQDGNERFVRANLGARALKSDDLTLLYICAPGGTVVWGEIRDPSSGQPLSLRDLPRERLAPSHPLLVEEAVPRSRAAPRGFVHGLVRTEEGPMLVSTRPILPSSGVGEVRGTVILGKLLTRQLVARLAERTWVSFEAWDLAGDMPPEARARIDEVSASPQPVIEEVSEDQLRVYTSYYDIQQAPALLMRATLPRAIHAQGASAVRYALISTISAGLLLLLVLLSVLQRTVLSPIGDLTRHAVEIGRTENPGSRIGMDRGDELGVLSREFDRMLEKLMRSRQALVSTARAAGMSEIASGILHNVGNVLNSVNVSAGLVAEQVRSSRIGKLQKLSRLVEEQGPDLPRYISEDPKGRHVAPYLSELARLLSVEHETVSREVDSLSRGVDHIRALVASQRNFAVKSSLREPTSAAEELEGALGISGLALEERGAPQIERHFEDVPTLRLDRHKLMQILVNLLKNAREAMEQAVTPDRKLVLRIARSEVDASRVRIVCADNGPGIAARDLTRVFHYGFTTKPGGLGVGLHAAANAAKELGGSLSVRSTPGQGAEFVLDLPIGGND